MTGKVWCCMKTISVELKGSSPILMNRFPMEPIEGLAKKSKEEQAEISAYRIPSKDDQLGELYVPGSAVFRTLINAGSYSKGKGRATLAKIIAACISIDNEYLGLGTTEYAIDSRPVVNPSTKGRIIKHRPMIVDWKISFDLSYNEILLTENQVRKVVDDAGMLVGLLDFRPACKGPFGRFKVSRWETSS